MTKKIQKPIPCPECNEGNLRRVLDCVEYRALYSTGPLAPYKLGETAEVQPTKRGDTSYIGCTRCDFMGSWEDVLRLMQPKPEPPPADPRYHTYLVERRLQPTGGVACWTLSGWFGNSAALIDALGDFADQQLAFAVLYRLTGIQGKPGQSVYTVSLET